MNGNLVAAMPKTRNRRRRIAAYEWAPLTMTWPEVAHAVFRASEAWLREHIGQYPDFPPPRDDLFSAKGVETWCNQRWGVLSPRPLAKTWTTSSSGEIEWAPLKFDTS
jgi:hypothetical protein